MVLFLNAAALTTHQMADQREYPDDLCEPIDPDLEIAAGVTCPRCHVSGSWIVTTEYGARRECTTCYASSGAAGTLDLVQCRVCGHISDGNLTCSRCDREAGRCCARLYHCQSNYCECKLCFRFACEACGACLPDRAYVSDVSPAESTSPYCDACRAIAAENCSRRANS